MQSPAPCQRAGETRAFPSASPFTHVKDEEAEGSERDGPNLLPVHRQAVPLGLILGKQDERGIKPPSFTFLCPKKKKKVVVRMAWYHEVLPTENDPEGEEHGVEDALPDVSEKQHPGPVEADGEPLHRDVDERHGDTESEDYPEGGRGGLVLHDPFIY